MLKNSRITMFLAGVSEGFYKKVNAGGNSQKYFLI